MTSYKIIDLTITVKDKINYFYELQEKVHSLNETRLHYVIETLHRVRRPNFPVSKHFTIHDL